MEKQTNEGISSRIAAVLRRTDAPLIGHVLPEGIELKGLLGGGATSDTYLGEKKDASPRYFAIKIFKPWVLRTPGESERIEREVTTMKEILHENLMRVYGFGIDESTHVPLVYLLNEYLDGPSLRTFLEGYKSLKPYLIADLMAQLCAGVARLHAHGIIHRDIKPENIIITTSQDGKNLLKLLDFGVIRSLTDKELTETDFFLGTVRYAAPEWIQGKGDSQALDLYSIGVVLYRIVTGKEPYLELGKNRAKLEYAILSKTGLFSTTLAPLLELSDAEHEWAEFFRLLGVWLMQYDASTRPSINETQGIFSEGINGKWWKLKISTDFLGWINSANFALRFPDDLFWRNEQQGKYRKEGEMIRNYLRPGHAILGQDCIEAFRTKIYGGLVSEIANFVATGRFSRTDISEIIEGLFSELRMDKGLENPFGHSVARPLTWDGLLIKWFEDYGFFDYVNNNVLNETAQSLVEPIVIRFENEYSTGSNLFAVVFPKVKSARWSGDDDIIPDWDWYFDYVEAAECCVRASKFCLTTWLEEFFLARAIAYYGESVQADGYSFDSNADSVLNRSNDIERGQWLTREKRVERSRKWYERRDSYIRDTIRELEGELQTRVNKNKHPLPVIEKSHSDGSEKLLQKTTLGVTGQFKFVPKMEEGLIVGLTFQSN